MAIRNLTLKQTVKAVLPKRLIDAIKRRLYSGAHEEQWARVVMNRSTRQLVGGIRPESLSVLEISGADWRGVFEFAKYRSVSYPEYDVCRTALGQTFDLIIAEQVFEHLTHPIQAGRNIYKMLENGGYFLISTPFLLRVHNEPVDCYRWTPLGLRHLLEDSGFDPEHIHTYSWGNRACVKANFKQWKPYRRWRHSLQNEPAYPVVVWGFARKI